jgi:HD-GYP domain-containing protein (c-di-GMP phosphodiesterase class II)
MTTQRSYDDVQSLDTALGELERHSGSQFDPVVVAAFRRVVTNQGARRLRLAS